MLSFGNKEFRNLQEQVLENMKNIQNIKEGSYVLDEFGIKVVAQVESIEDIPTVGDYKEQNPDWEYGDAYAVGTESPYELYILTREGGIQSTDYWFNIGEFPVAGPQGPQGETGATGATPSVSMSVGSVTTLDPGQSATATVSKSGTLDAPVFTLSFSIPQGAQGIQGVQGEQGPAGPQGPQGIQGPQGPQGFLYTVVGQVSAASSLPTPSTVDRDSAYLVGASEPYDVYVIIGDDPADLEWINLGPIATIAPNVYIASVSYMTTGSFDSPTLAAINNETAMHYIKDGNIYFGYSSRNTYTAQYVAMVYDQSSQLENIYRMSVSRSTGVWNVTTSAIADTAGFVTTGTAQTITAQKTFGPLASILFSGQTGYPNALISNTFGELTFGIGGPSPTPYASNLSVSSEKVRSATLTPLGTSTDYDLGSAGIPWNDLYLHGDIYMNGVMDGGNYNAAIKNVSDYLTFVYDSVPVLYVGQNNIKVADDLIPTIGDNYNLGSSTNPWSDLYLDNAIVLKNNVATTVSSINGNVSGAMFTINNVTTSNGVTTSTPIYKFTTSAILPDTTETNSLGADGKVWGTIWSKGLVLYKAKATALGGRNYATVDMTDLGRVEIDVNGTDAMHISSSETYVYGNLKVDGAILPPTNGTNDLGGSVFRFRDLYLKGSLKDGTNSVSVANILPVTGNTSNPMTGELLLGERTPVSTDPGDFRTSRAIEFGNANTKIYRYEQDAANQGLYFESDGYYKLYGDSGDITLFNGVNASYKASFPNKTGDQVIAMASDIPNIVYSATQPQNPTTGMIWLEPVA